MEADAPLAPPLRRLPSRRQHLIRRVDAMVAGIPDPVSLHVQATYQITAGGPQVVECFVRGAHKGNGPRDEELSEIAILISLLLRLGNACIGIRRKLSAPDDDGRATSIVSAIVDALVAAQDELLQEWRGAA